MFRLRFKVLLYFGQTLLIILLANSLIAQDLTLRIGQEGHRVGGATRDGQSYFRLRDLIAILELSTNETSNQIEVFGARGRLSLFDGRPLVHLGDQYILLTAPAWRRGQGNWYVPLDFVEKVLPGILNSKLTKEGDRTYRVEGVGRNRVRVEFLSYPDHLSVVFRSSRSGVTVVQEYRDYIEVRFGEYLVSSDPIVESPVPGLVTAVTFVSEEALGTFRVQKGGRYYSFRESRLSDPPRLVLDVFPRPGTERRGGGSGATVDLPARPRTGTSEESADEEPEPQPRIPAVVIDPGHGGEDYGVDVYQDVLEKGLALVLARKIEQRLTGSGEEVRLTRFRDVDLTAEQRSAVGNFHRAKVFVSVHVGGAPSSQTSGAVVYVYDPPPAEFKVSRPDPESAGSEAGDPVELVRWNEGQLGYVDTSRQLAELMQTELNKLFGVENRVVEARLAVLAPVMAPAVVVETGFLTNAEDLELLGSEQFQETLAYTIAQVIRKFLESR